VFQFPKDDALPI